MLERPGEVQRESKVELEQRIAAAAKMALKIWGTYEEDDTAIKVAMRQYRLEARKDSDDLKVKVQDQLDKLRAEKTLQGSMGEAAWNAMLADAAKAEERHGDDARGL